METIKKNRRDLFFYIIVLTWAVFFSLLGFWLVTRFYTPIPAAAQMAGIVLSWAMILLIIASILVCLYIIRLFIRA
jgi:hypothetical protein